MSFASNILYRISAANNYRNISSIKIIYGHTKLEIPVVLRILKLSNLGHGLHLDGVTLQDIEEG